MANEWYFQEGDERFGPISPAALKQLADSGRIKPDTLIWKDGLPSWAPAKSVKGLFSATAAAGPNPEPTPSSSPPVRPPDPVERPNKGWHPFDLLVAAGRQAVPASLPATISRVAGVTGIYAVYAAALASLLVGIILAIRTNQFSALGIFAASAFAMIVIQYTAHRLLDASDEAVRANTSFLSSYAVPDCVFVLTVFGTLGGVVWLLWQSISEGSLNLALAAVAVLAVGVFVSMVALHPSEIRVLEKPECQASEDAIGFLTFIVKLFLRCAPILFAAAIVYGTYQLGYATVSILRAEKEIAGFVGFRAVATVGLVLAATAIPFYAYLLTILYYLSLDVLSAIVSIPAKLDLIANGKANSSED
jgi:hypothetical protein